MARHLISSYTFEAGTRTISLPSAALFGTVTIENIRLIVNETQKKVICSSMQKDNIVSISDNAITYVSTIPALASGDKLTIEVDMGEDYYGSVDKILNAKAGNNTVFSYTDGYLMRNGSFSLFAGGAFTYIDLSAKTGALDTSRLFANCTLLKEVKLGITYINNNISGLFVNCTSLTKVDMSMLQGVYPRGMEGQFSNNPVLTEIDCRSFNSENASRGKILPDTVKKVSVYSKSLAHDGSGNIISLNHSNIIEDITIYGEMSYDIKLTTSPLLNFNTVKHILTRANEDTMSGKTISFYSSGLTITDDSSGTLAALKTAVEARGCTIANLTITPYSA